MNGKTIFVADDEANICHILCSFLEQAGYRVESFYSGSALLEAHRQQPADLLVIDIMMPGLDGYALCETLRRESNVPVVFVSARDAEQDKIRGLTLGGDDYLTKPFSPMELVARVNGIFRRMAMEQGASRAPGVLRMKDLHLNTETLTAATSRGPLALTAMEFNLLTYLLEHRSRAVSRQELLDKVWGFEEAVQTRATDDMIKRLRRKLHQAGSPVVIETVWGYGFRIPED